MNNKHFKLHEKVYFFNNRNDEPVIEEGIITGALKREGIYDYIYEIAGVTASVTAYRWPYQIYSTLDEIKEGILDYVIRAEVHK